MATCHKSTKDSSTTSALIIPGPAPTYCMRLTSTKPTPTGTGPNDSMSNLLRRPTSRVKVHVQLMEYNLTWDALSPSVRTSGGAKTLACSKNGHSFRSSGPQPTQPPYGGSSATATQISLQAFTSWHACAAPNPRHKAATLRQSFSY